MQQPLTPTRTSIAAGSVTLAGGVLAILGSALSWGKVSVGAALGGRSISAAGTNANHGKIILALGIVMSLIGMVVAVAPRRDLVVAMAVVALLAGLAVTALAVYNIATKDQQFVRGFRRGFEQVTGQRLTNAQVRQLAARFGIRLSLGPGLFVAVAGGLIGAVGGVLGLATSEGMPRWPGGAGAESAPAGSTPAPGPEAGPTEPIPPDPDHPEPPSG